MKRRCPKCRRNLDESWYWRTGSYCKTCHRADASARYNAAREAGTLPHFEPAEKRQCLACMQILPGTEFYPAKTNPTGLTSYCKACTRVKSQWRRSRSKWWTGATR